MARTEYNYSGMSQDQTRVGPTHGGIRFDIHQFDTGFLRRHWIKVLIQEIPGGRYWQYNGGWTSDVQAATSFATCTAALAHAAKLDLPNAQLVLIRESNACGIIPLEAGALRASGEKTAETAAQFRNSRPVSNYLRVLHQDRALTPPKPRMTGQ